MFASPLPNKQIWNGSTCGQLQAQDQLSTGGWWHNPDILSAVGQGIEIEEPRAWQGCWNEQIVELVRLSTQDENALSVLLTGRQEDRFSDLIGRMIASKGLEFDIVALKPSVGPNAETFSSTMLFKQTFLRDIIFTYTTASSLTIYEDRLKHVKGFRDFFEDLNKSIQSTTPHESVRDTIEAEVIQINDVEAFMDPTTEVAEVQKMINTHNRAILSNLAPPHARPFKIKRSVFYTGYLISPPDIEKLKTLVKLPPNCPEHEIKHLANNILITPRPAPRSILDKVGGLGAKMTWRVTGLANLENRVWAARVAPTNPNDKFYTENPTPCIVLATRRQAKPIEATRIQNWQPVQESQAFEFETTVGEKVLLRVEEEVAGEDGYEALFPNSGGKNARKHPREEDFPPLGSGGSQVRRDGSGLPKAQARPQQRSGNAWQGGGIGFAAQRGAANAGAGGGRGYRGGGGQSGGSGFRGRGGRGGGGGGGGMQRGGAGGRGRGGYRSLDANVGQGYGGGSMEY